MDLDSAKENIQPLAAGRNIQRLEAALSAESQETMLNQRYEFENAIRNYTGDDPLSAWYDYVEWVEQSYPKSGKESSLDDLIEKCLLQFESDDRYKQDPRMIRLYIKYIDSQPNQQEHFQSLYSQGVGTMVADLYICWAYYYDIANNFERANAVYRMGLDARAEPFDQLEQAHQQFGFSMSQRLLNKDDNFNKNFLASMEERRYALTSLRSHRRKHVGSIRTGGAIKSHEPGRIQQHRSNLASSSNTKIQVYEENSPNDHQFRHPADVMTMPPPTSVVHSIMDSSKKKENIREPGPWANAKKSTSSTNKVFTNTNITTAFPIMVDMDVTCNPLSPIPLPVDMHAIGFIQPRKFSPRNLPFLTEFDVPYFVEEEIPAGVVAAYDKIMLFPKPTKSFSIEESSAYKWFKKNRITNAFTAEQDKLWQNNFEVGIRLPPQFCPKNESQDEFLVERYIEDESNLCPTRKFCFKFSQLYLPSEIHEHSNEELLFKKWQNGRMASQLKEEPSPLSDSMDETVMIKGRQSICHGATRKSIVPGGRKSIMPMTDDAGYKRKSLFPSKIRSNNEIAMNNELKAGDETPKSTLVVNKSVISAFLSEKETEIEQDKPVSPVGFSDQHEFLTPAAAPKRVLSIFAKTPTSSAPPAMHNEEQQDKTPEIIQKEPSMAQGESKQISIFAKKSITVDSAPKLSKLDGILTSKEDSTDIGPEKSLGSINATPIPILSTPGFVNSTGAILPTLGFVKSTGVLRKSICPSKRKNDSPDFGLPLKSPCLSVADEPQLPSVEVRELIPVSGFTIFEDPNPASPEKSTMNAVVFKTPHQIRTSRKSLAPLGLPEEFEETFSTQNFNFFIKSQSVSTPKAENPAKSVVQHTVSEKCEPATTTTPKIISPICVTGGPTQLSTILEITETNTLSSATASTKSTIDAQYTTSPETENEVTIDKSHQLAKSMQSSLTPPSVDHSSGQRLLRTKLSMTEPVTGDVAILPEINDLKISTEPVEVQPHLIEPFQIYEDRTETARSIQLPSTDIPSMCHIRLYEDRTETVPFLNFTKPLEQSLMANSYEPTLPPLDFNETSPQPMKAVTEKIVPISEDSIRILANDFTLPSMCPIPIYDRTETIPILSTTAQTIDHSMKIPSISPIKIYEDTTETLAAINLKKIEANSRNDDFVPAFSSIRITGDESADLRMQLPRKSTIENYQPVTVPYRQNTSQQKQPFGVLFSATKPIPTESAYKKEEEDLFDVLLQTPVKPIGLSRIPVAKSVKQPCFADFLPPSSVIDTTCSSLLEPMVHRLDMTNDSQVFRQPYAVASSISQHQDNISDDIRTEQFDMHLNAISNSTFCQKARGIGEKTATDKEFSRIEQKSLHIKEERLSDIGVESLEISKRRAAGLGELSVSFSEEDLRKIDIAETMENSIYVKCVSLDVVDEKEHWSEVSDNFDEATICVGKYLRHTVDLNETEHIIEEHIDNSSDPFDAKVQQAFLEKYDLMGFIEREVDSCQMVNTLRPLRVNTTVELNERNFTVLSLIGKGAFGSVFSGKCNKTGLTYAMKQQRPANLWEYYICLEIQSRIEFDNILPAFMKVECSIIANNASLLVSELSPYGSILDVCNKIKAKSSKNCPSSVVMILATQMLTIVDHLHACSIIHADIKPDNWLLMRRLDVDPNVIVLKLIDFGQSIDLQLYPKGQKFHTKLNTKNFICTEMLDGRPWTFQTDLFCLASTVHACLFGQYMEVARISSKTSQYHITTNIPRYYPKVMWTTFFETLINVKDCNTMPNLQHLKTLLLKEIQDVKEAYNNVRAVNDIISTNI